MDIIIGFISNSWTVLFNGEMSDQCSDNPSIFSTQVCLINFLIIPNSCSTHSIFFYQFLNMKLSRFYTVILIATAKKSIQQDSTYYLTLQTTMIIVVLIQPLFCSKLYLEYICLSDILLCQCPIKHYYDILCTMEMQCILHSF